eukprot:scaffold224112_cov30-Tisochrysis_lutea.AAC.2
MEPSVACAMIYSYGESSASHSSMISWTSQRPQPSAPSSESSAIRGQTTPSSSGSPACSCACSSTARLPSSSIAARSLWSRRSSAGLRESQRKLRCQVVNVVHVAKP